MATSAKTYFYGLKSHLNLCDYAIPIATDGIITLEEHLFLSGGREVDQVVTLNYSGEIIAIELDKKNKHKKPKKSKKDKDETSTNLEKFFTFLKDESKPWARKCDFVIFQLIKNRIMVYCIEFKSGSIPSKTVDQLEASESWCKALHSIISLYTGEKRRMNLCKYIFTSMDDPSNYVDENGHLIRDHQIKHYNYDELDGMSLEDLIHDCIIQIG